MVLVSYCICVRGPAIEIEEDENDRSKERKKCEMLAFLLQVKSSGFGRAEARCMWTSCPRLSPTSDRGLVSHAEYEFHMLMEAA